MTVSRYPRLGQRLAPAALREILDVPLPASVSASAGEGPLRLAGLDETAWQRFGPEGCRELAAAVVAAVRRAIRRPSPVLRRRLPLLPAGMPVAGLALEARTINSLQAAGLLERTAGLQAMTVQQVLGLRGFWARSLVDLLTAMEHAADHAEAAGAVPADVPDRFRPPSSRYPHPGQRLAPRILGDLLSQPIPEHLVGGSPLAGARWCELDETAWAHLSPEVIGQLGRGIAARVAAGVHAPAVSQRRVPRPPKSLRLDDLRLEGRTDHCLRRVGFADRLQELQGWTIGEVLSIPGFGAKCLLDLLCALETAIGREGKLDHKLTAEARSLAALPEAGRVGFGDPRLGATLRSLDPRAGTLEEMALGIVRRRTDPADAAGLAARLAQLRQRIEELRGQPLEEELADIFAAGGRPRDRRILAAHFGWDGGPGWSPEQLAGRHGLSRERVRQICVQAVERAGRGPVFAPVLDRVLAFVTRHLPAPAEQIEGGLRQSAVTCRGLALEAICQAAEHLHRVPPAAVVRLEAHRLAVRPGQERLPQAAAQAARRLAHQFGAATIAGVRTELDAKDPELADCETLVSLTLSRLAGFAWLDKRQAWFGLDCGAGHGLRARIDKILSVAGQIEAVPLREALGRQRALRRRLPPAAVLLEYCRRAPGLVVEGTRVGADPVPDWRTVLPGVERELVRALRDQGPVLARGPLADHCRRRGVNRLSFSAALSGSPIIARVGRGLYGLVGSRPRRRVPVGAAVRTPLAPREGHTELSWP